jgi:hypothetical protein
MGGQGVPIFSRLAIPKNPHSTIVATDGITGDLDQEWFLRLKAAKP